MPWADAISNTVSLGLVAGWVALRGYELYEYMNRRDEERQQLEEAGALPRHSSQLLHPTQTTHLEWHSGAGGGPVVFTFHGNPAAAEFFGFPPFGPAEDGFDLVGNPRQGQIDMLNYRLGMLDRDFTEADYEMLLALDDDNRRHGAAPLPQAQLEALPLHTHHKRSPPTSTLTNRKASGSADGAASPGAVEEAQTCSICLEEFAEGAQVMALPCLHQYHAGCVEPWLQQNGRGAACPICKTPVFHN